ncbi:stage II sporulation protein M [Paenibacillus larvae subsp. larvae]|uniref:Stage II sporulation protein M n=1 Tax=Paenibacillus larvae subsp. larvae TaxID=147375 RepID=A0A2L1UC11_9BACL|nr:stage II sporulation protein M [Paenibacillus larvae]AQT86187.1 stage II sporulation protein M [Paenibacillus larvae subsp. pulvifaciens]AQZ47807.1 stage II sporulation protein M [Paenibacillus larvae subsp. pulvifaciens]AVF25693.1 stage II sporulation protein M [Paenibacillus larvae subsp. larvae]AVF30470.1 stage II sporulation protein M [Paenibacillus larvae subsp. larvae]MBH0341895.1 stage II sporulation protein M [Paenibacillus larvae]
MLKKQTMKLYLKENLTLYVFVSVLFVVGVIFGAVMVNALSLEQKQDMSRHLGSFFQSVNDGSSLDGKDSFFQTFGMHIRWVLLIWVLGLSIIGLPLILILDFLKGVLVGFTVGYLVGQLSWKGILFSLVSVAPQNLIIIPALLICSVSAISFSLYIIKFRLLQRKGSIHEPFMRHSGITLTAAAVLLAVALFEGFISPHMMRWVTPILAALYPG